MEQNPLEDSVNYLEQNVLDVFRNEAGCSVRYYFDSFDVIKMMDGLREYQSTYFLSFAEFSTTETLIRALAYFGWIDSRNQKIGLLPGHQEELYKHAKSKYSPISKIDERTYKELLDEIGLSENLGTKDSGSINEKLKKIEKVSSKLVVLNYILDKENWIDRLEYLVKDVLKLSKKGEIRNLDEDPLFEHLMNYFEKERPKAKANNFNDSIALTALSKKLKDFDNYESNELPIFFASTSTIRRILKKKNLKQHFRSKRIVKNKKFPIIRDESFILMDCTFDLNKSHNLITESASNIVELYRMIDSGKKISHIDEISALAFFEKFIYQKVQKDELCRKVTELILTHLTGSASGELESSYWEDILSDQRKKLLDLLKGDHVKYEIAIDFRKSLKTFKSTGNNFNLDAYQNNPFTGFGLTRFSFENYNQVRLNINDLLEQFLGGEEFSASLEKKLTSRLYNGLMNEHEVADLEIVLSILWTFKKYKLINRICFELSKSEVNKYRLIISFAILHLSTSIKLDRPTSEILKHLDSVEKITFNNSRQGDKNLFRKEIGLSYVYFNIWKEKFSGYSFIPELRENKVEADSYLFLEKSIDYLESALNWLRQNKDKDQNLYEYRNTKYYYALNNFIFYVTAGGDVELFDRLSKKVKILANNWKNSSSFTQSRFAETLARYYFRKSYLSNDYSDKVELLDQAKRTLMEGKVKSISESDHFSEAHNYISDYSKDISKKKTGKK